MPTSDRRKQRPLAAALVWTALATPAWGLAPPEVARVDWEAVEALAAAGDVEAALGRLGALDSAALDAADRLRAARLETRLLHGLGRFAEARRAGEAWAERASEAGDAREQAGAWRAAARAAYLSGMPRDADRLIERALEAVGRIDPADPEVETEVLADRVTVLAGLGEYTEAEALVDRARRLGGGADDPRRAHRLAAAWGTTLHQAGDLLPALEQREAALAAAEAADDTALVASALSNLAQTEIGLHDYAAALGHLQRVLDTEGATRNRRIALVTVGICHLELNQLDQATAAFAEAERLAREAGDDPVEGWALGERGLLEAERGRAAEALDLFDRAIASTRRSGDRRNEAVWWANRGRVRRDQGRWQEALADYARAEHLEGEIPGQRPDANLRKHMGQCHAGLGDEERAEALFRRALELAEGTGDTKVVWETRRELARLYTAQGRFEAAGEAWEEALAGIEAIRGSLRLDALAADFFADKVGVYGEAIDFLLAHAGPGGAERAFAVAERARARAFLASLVEARARLEPTLPSELLAQERGLLATISRLQAAERRGAAQAADTARLAAAEGDLEALELRVRSEAPRFSELRGLVETDVAAVQAALEPGEVLLEYFLADGGSHLWRIDRASIAHHALPSADTVEERVRRALTDLMDPSSTPRLEALAGDLLGSVTPGGRAPARLLVVPSGILHYLPFEALPLGDGHLVDRSAVSYLPSASALVELRSRPVEPAPPRLLAVGDPPSGNEPAPARRVGFAGVRGLGALPHTRREVERIRSRFGAGRSTALLGPEAAEGRLKAEPLDRYSVLHLAVHGWIDASSAARCGLVLGPGPGDDDGLLQFREILRLRLAADLVTLSACQSALGELVTGEGMVGLARAFFYAGSDSVVASLWSVADDATADLMAEFYRGLAEGLPKAEALRRARLAVRADPRYAHPYYWASFVLLGRGEDGVEIPRRGPPAAIPITLAAVAAVGGLGLLGWKLRRRRRELEVRTS